MSKRFKKISYTEKLQDRRWQQKRLEIMQRDNFCCQYPNCTSTKSMLDVHHKAYLRNVNPWEYPAYCLITLCRAHHEIEQSRLEQAHLAIASNPQLIDHCIKNTLENSPVSSRSQQKVEKSKPVSADVLNQMRAAIKKGKP